MALTAVGAVLVGWLPGAMVFRLPRAERDRRAALPAEERAFWAIVLSLVWSLIVVLVLASLGDYTFNRLILINAGVCAAVALLYRSRLSYGGRAAAISRYAILPVALVALGWWLFQPPAEYVMGGKDPGVYMNEGVQTRAARCPRHRRSRRGGRAVPSSATSSSPSTTSGPTTARGSWASSSRTRLEARSSANFRISFPRRLRLATGWTGSPARDERSASGPCSG